MQLDLLMQSVDDGGEDPRASKHQKREQTTITRKNLREVLIAQAEQERSEAKRRRTQEASTSIHHTNSNDAMRRGKTTVQGRAFERGLVQTSSKSELNAISRILSTSRGASSCRAEKCELTNM